MKVDAETGLLTQARQVPSPNCDERPVDDEPELIVIHGISLPPGEYGGPWIDRLFTNALPLGWHPYFDEIRDRRVSAHLLVRRNGEIVQYVPFHLRAWHAGDSCYQGRTRCNDFSIGIEVEGVDDGPYELVQYERLSSILRLLGDAYPRLNSAEIVGHSDIAPLRKTDPGAAFDWACLRKLIDEVT